MTLDVLVVGAGPAGLAAGAVAAEAGAEVLVLDESGTAGGQYLHPRSGRTIEHPAAQRFVASEAALVLGEPAWHLDSGSRTLYTVRREIGYRALVLATGAFDRPLALPGRQLRGVMTAGAAQRLSKDRVRLGERAVVAGSGPFAFPVALEILGNGTEVAEVALTHFPLMGTGSIHAPQILREGAGLAARAARHRLRVRTGWALAEILGDTHVEAVVLTGIPRGRRAKVRRTVSCDMVALGYGFLPQLAVADLAGCDLRYDPVHRTWFVAVDPSTLETNVDGVYAAGEITGIGGHRKALAEGALAGAGAAARALGRAPSGTGRRRVRAMRRFAATAGRSLAPPALAPLVADDAVVCTCENVTAAEIRAAAADGAATVQGVRMRTRCGMGRCQARMCGQLSGEIVEECLGLSPGAAGRIAARTPARPLTLGEIIS